MVVEDTLSRARRIALLGEFVASFEKEADRLDVIRRLRAGEVITRHTADLLIETCAGTPA